MTSLSRIEKSFNQLDPIPSQRYHKFFKERVYEYRATLQSEEGAKEIQFELPLIPYLKSLKESKAIGVRDILVKGGAAHYIFTGHTKRVADLDLIIEIEKPQNWNEVERIFFDTLGIQGKIGWFEIPKEDGSFDRTYFQEDQKLFTQNEWTPKGSLKSLFLLKGALGNRKLFLDDRNEFAIYTIPTFHNQSPQKIDFTVHVKSQNSCFSSYDACRPSLMPIFEETSMPIPIRMAQGYGLEESMTLSQEGKYTSKNPEAIYEGLALHCRALTRGYCPDDWGVEKIFWHGFLKQYQPSGFKSFKEILLRYNETHFFHSPLEKIFYLLNRYGAYSRCAEKGAFEEVERILIDELYRAAELPIPSLEEARSEIEAIFAQKRGKAPFHLFSNTYSETAESKDEYLLLQQLFPKERGRELMKFGISDEKNIEASILELIDAKPPEIRNAEIILTRSLKQPGLISSDSLKRIFESLCCSGSMGVAEKIYRLFVKEDHPYYLTVFAKKIEKESDLKKLFEMLRYSLEKEASNFETYKELIESALKSSIEEYPSLFQSVKQLLEKIPSQFHEPLRLHLHQNCEKSLSCLFEEKKVLKEEAAEKKEVNLDEVAKDKGIAHFDKKEYKKALLQFQKIKNPSVDILNNYIGRCHHYLGSLGEFAKALQKAVELDPSNETLWFNLSQVYFGSGQMEMAFKSAEEGRKLFPNSVQMLDLLAKLHKKEIDRMSIQSKIGDITAKLKTVAKLYAECARIEPKNGQWLNNCGIFCMRLKSYEKALRWFEGAHQLEPDNESIMRNIKECRLKL